MCVRWSKLPICKLPKHKLPTGRLPTRKLHTTSYNFAQLHTTLHNFAGVEWSGELPICKLPKLKLPTCRLPTRKLHTKCVCGEANFQLTNFHNINFQNVCVWREANFQLTHFSQHKLSKRVCGEANFQNFQLTNFHNINFQKWRSISPCMSHGCQCLHAYHTVVNVSMHVTWCQMSPYISHSFSSYSRHRCHNVVLLLAFDIGIHSVHYLICYCSVCGLRQQHVLTRL